ncbi:hypothetical protein, partial [Pseudonocardia alni]|uniref:hypothetical protein n=1 Tax=Pseudonocardia alni TaxID=33907 RepID=UPI00280C2C61
MIFFFGLILMWLTSSPVRFRFDDGTGRCRLLGPASGKSSADEDQGDPGESAGANLLVEQHCA